MPNLQYPIAVVNAEPRKSLFEKIYGTNRIPVKTIMPFKAVLPDFDTPQEVLMLDFNRLTDQQIRNLADYVAEAFGQERKGLEGHLMRVGFPILANGLDVATSLKFWI